jgi:hypothetical protein
LGWAPNGLLHCRIENHENEKMRPMPREVGLRSALSQYMERPLVGSPEFLFYSM